MTHSTELHCFKNADEVFQSKHDNFITHYLGKCIMGADALNHTPILDASFVHKDSHDTDKCSLILNSVIKSEPLIRIKSNLVNHSHVILDIFYINEPFDVEDFYCLKTTYDFMVEGVMLYQIFEVNVKSLTMINNFWLTR